MKFIRNPTQILPGFPLSRPGRKRRTAQQILADKIRSLRQKQFKQIGAIFEPYIPRNLLKPEQEGVMSRQRLYTKENTFWAFFGQVLDADGGCKEVVRKLQAYASLKGVKIPSSSTASYCAARKKLDPHLLREIFEHTARHGDRKPKRGLLANRRVVVVDGSGLSMPDTPENQDVWPQSATQAPGCGFPSARVCACFNLESGAMLSYAIGSKKTHELPLFRSQWNTLRKGDIFLGDKGFCSYFDMAELKKKGVDSVVTLARRKPVKRSDCLQELGPDDWLIQWDRPPYNRILSYSREQWAQLPEKLMLRQIRVTVEQPGFRTKGFVIVTTLLDPVKYPSEEVAQLYLKRWDVELFFRDIKTTIGMDVLRCQTPGMIRKEIAMYFIAYNCIRRLMYEAAEQVDCEVRLISFKGSVQAVRNWEPRLNHEELSRVEKDKLLQDLYGSMTNLRIRQRPGRQEPRCFKRRHKAYQLLTKPRHIMREIEHRNRYTAGIA
jgi:hypothetical protein